MKKVSQAYYATKLYLRRMRAWIARKPRVDVSSEYRLALWREAKPRFKSCWRTVRPNRPLIINRNPRSQK